MILYSLKAHLRSMTDLLVALAFFVLSLSFFQVFFPGLGGLEKTGIIWMLALFTVLIKGDTTAQESANGILDQLRLAGVSPVHFMVAKTISLWGVMVVPLTFVAAVTLVLSGIPVLAVGVFGLSFVLGLLGICLLVVMFSILTLSIPQAPFLLIILIFPFVLPVLIFSLTATEAALLNQPVNASLLFLGAELCFLAVLCPIASWAGMEILKE